MPEPRVTVVSEEDAEAADFVVCCTADMPRRFHDDVETTCHDCRAGIFHRPSAPKKPHKICFHCALERAEAGRA